MSYKGYTPTKQYIQSSQFSHSHSFSFPTFDMTVNSDEYDDLCKVFLFVVIPIHCDLYIFMSLYQIKIKKTNPESHARRHSRQFLEKGLGALLANEHFLLLYVPANGAKMKTIRPVSDPHHLRRMMKKANEATRIPSFYFALSHLWGISENNRHLWYDISKYVDDENGQPAAPVPMRPEKRDTLLRLLRHYPDSYWWIDVLCARSDTPLDIMGDIYSCSIRCIAMVDCPPTLIPQLNTMKDARKDFPRLKSQRGSQSQQYYHSYKELYDEKYPQLIDLLYTLTQSEWWKRVWTWQEMALPFGGVRLLSETATHVSRSNTVVVDKLVYNFEGAVNIWHDIHNEHGGTLYIRSLSNNIANLCMQ